MQSMLKEFRTFVLRGSLVDMAIGIVIGIAFAALVGAFVTDLITPIVAALAGKHDFSSLSFTIHKSRFLYGDFINAVVTFLSIAAAPPVLGRARGLEPEPVGWWLLRFLLFRLMFGSGIVKLASG